jgi:dihydropteroate synthase
VPLLREVDRTQVMGVINVTPDSFSDGGTWFDTGAAIAHGLELVAAGADLVDVGGESTRPGAQRVGLDEEQRRVIPVVRALTAQGICVSVDTMNAATAERAIDAGASLVNDVSGGLADPRMLQVAAEAGIPFVVMHWRAHSTAMQSNEHTRYDNLVDDVVAELAARVRAAEAAGIDPVNIIVDPGLGFSKTGEQNWELLAHLDRFVGLGHRVLLAASRKRFLGYLLATDGVDRPVEAREDATAALTVLAAVAGVWGVRVHAARPSADAVRVVQRLVTAAKDQ